MPEYGYNTLVCNGHVTSGGTLVHGALRCPLHGPQAEALRAAGHCCACSVVCHHIGGPWLCEDHKPDNPASAYNPPHTWPRESDLDFLREAQRLLDASTGIADSLRQDLAAAHAKGVAEGRAQRDLEVEALAELRRAAERMVAHWQRPELPGPGHAEAGRRAQAMLTHAVKNLTAAPPPSVALERALSAYSGATEYSITFDEGDVAESPPVGGGPS